MSSRIRPEVADQVGELFLETARDLFGYASTLTHGNAMQSEDLVQMTFQAAALSWAKLKDRDHEGRRRWLYRVLHNKAIDSWRRNERLQPCDDLPEAAQIQGETSHQALCAVTLERCWAVIAKMPPTQQQVAFLRWGQDWSTSEIAAWLKITQTTVRGHLMRARADLHDQMGDELPFIDDPEEDDER